MKLVIQIRKTYTHHTAKTYLVKLQILTISRKMNENITPSIDGINQHTTYMQECERAKTLAYTL